MRKAQLKQNPEVMNKYIQAKDLIDTSWHWILKLKLMLALVMQ